MSVWSRVDTLEQAPKRPALLLEKHTCCPEKAHLSWNVLFFGSPGKAHPSLGPSWKSTPVVL